MTTGVITRSQDELLAWREEILSRLGLSYEELAEKADTYLLTADERSAWETLRGIDFLLGDE
jgi:hypothetical protein